jgi:hypothetical protein
VKASIEIGLWKGSCAGRTKAAEEEAKAAKRNRKAGEPVSRAAITGPTEATTSAARCRNGAWVLKGFNNQPRKVEVHIGGVPTKTPVRGQEGAFSGRWGAH